MNGSSCCTKADSVHCSSSGDETDECYPNAEASTSTFLPLHFCRWSCLVAMDTGAAQAHYTPPPPIPQLNGERLFQWEEMMVAWVKTYHLIPGSVGGGRGPFNLNFLNFFVPSATSRSAPHTWWTQTEKRTVSFCTVHDKHEGCHISAVQR